MRIKEVSANKLQIEALKAFPHEHVEELEIFMVASVDLTSFGDGNLVWNTFVVSNIEVEGLWVLICSVEDHSVKEISSQLTLQFKQHVLSNLKIMIIGKILQSRASANVK
jgi:hypothetical protein